MTAVEKRAQLISRLYDQYVFIGSDYPTELSALEMVDDDVSLRQIYRFMELLSRQGGCIELLESPTLEDVKDYEVFLSQGFTEETAMSEDFNMLYSGLSNHYLELKSALDYKISFGSGFEQFVQDSIGADKSTQASKLTAELSFTSISIPTITVGNDTYKFTPMQEDAAPFRIISYCLEHYPGSIVTLEELKKELQAKSIPLHGVKNIKEAIRNNSLFGTSKPLSVFIKTISPKGIEVCKIIEISKSQLQNIAEIATHSQS